MCFSGGSLDYRPYDSHMECRWYLEVPSNFTMNLTVDELFMEAGDGCPFDYMMIYDGNDTTQRAYGRYCSHLPAFTIYATGRQMLITAHTDERRGHVGFRGVYQVPTPANSSDCNFSGHSRQNDTMVPLDQYIRYYLHQCLIATYDLTRNF